MKYEKENRKILRTHFPYVLGYQNLENGGISCYSECNQIQGKCDWCGTDGWCCRKDWVGNGCDGTFGINNHHQCVLKPGNLDFQRTVLLFNFQNKSAVSMRSFRSFVFIAFSKSQPSRLFDILCFYLF